MKFKWLNKKNNNNLIVFFSGWGSSSDCIKLQALNYDVLFIYDYRTFDPINIDFSDYEKKYLIAWSMGVFICNYYYEQFKNFDKIIAVNGTQKPIDNTFGIPIMIYDLTINNFNKLSCSKFIKKMSSDLNMEDYCTRSIEELKQELISIKNLKTKHFLHFDKAIVSEKDKIIPSKNQLNWWQNQNVRIEQLENAPHYIFGLYKNWSDLI